MRFSKIAIVVSLSALAASTSPAFAQSQELILGPQFEQRFEELATWVREYHAWEQWFERWGNRVARNFADQHIWERKQRPQPPVWLEAECQGYLGVDDLLATACSLLRNWDDHPVRILQRRRTSVVTSGGNVADKVVKSSFFRRVHLTGLWMRAQYPSSPVYGVVGMQVAVFEVGRFTVPALGVMVVMMPDGEGGHDWRPASTLAFGYRISDFVVPFLKKPASLHINVARTSIHGLHDARIPPGTMNSNFFGLSVSPRKRR
jgi:hypothetical protein